MAAGFNIGSFVGGLAKSLDDRLKDDMRRTGERSDRVRDYHVTRASRKEERFEAEQKELEETLSNLAGFMSQSGIEIPEGVTEADFAAQLYKGAGGTLSGGKQLVKDLSEHRSKAGDIKGLIQKADFATKGKGFGDYVNNFVRRPSSMIKVPENLRGGTGFLKNVDITKGMQGEMDAMFTGDKQADKFDVSGLSLDRSKMVGSKEYSLSMETAELGNKQAKANLNKTLRENAMLGSIDKDQVNKDYNRVLADGVKAAGIAVSISDNGTPQFDIKTGTQQYKDVQKVYANALQNVTENALRTNALSMPGMKSTLKTLAQSPYLAPINTVKNKIDPSNFVIGQIYSTKNKGDVLWTGNMDTSIFLKGAK